MLLYILVLKRGNGLVVHERQEQARCLLFLINNLIRIDLRKKKKKNNGKQTSWKRILWLHSWKAYKLILYLLADFKLCRTDKVSCKLKFSNYLATSFIVHFSAMSIRPNASLAKTRVLHGQVYRSLSYTFCKLLSLLLLLLLLLLYCCCYCCGYFCCPLFTPSKSFDRKSPKSRNLDYLEKFLT